MRAPGRRLSCTTWPSTHSVDIFSTYSPIFIDSRRTGHGCSAVVSAARSGSGPRPWGAGVLMRRTLDRGGDGRGRGQQPRAVRARTWETVVPPTSAYGVAKSTPSDHNVFMTWAFV